VVISVNAFIAIFQQYRAQKQLAALQALTTDTAIVIRDGQKQEIDTGQITVGDVVTLSQGEKVPADGRLFEAHELTVVEASLTGESQPVLKTSAKSPLPEMTPLHARTNMVYRGTYIATGSGRYLATGIGQDTEIGKISQGLETLNTGDIPLRRKVNRLALILGIAAFSLGILGVLSYLFFPRGPPQTLLELGTDAIINAMTVLPINIPLLTTIVLLTGVLAMANRGVIVRDLSAVESLGRISILCTDKTGTLTRSEMMVSLIWDGHNLFHVTGSGFLPKGEICLVDKSQPEKASSTNQSISIDDFDQLALLLRIGGLNNDSELVAEKIEKSDKVQWKAIGDPTEAALLALLRKSEISESSLHAAYTTEKDYPFDSTLKRMTRVFSGPHGDYVAFVKGATDVLLERCTHIGNEHKAQKLSKKQKKEILKYSNDFAAGGYRVLSFAVRVLDQLPKGSGSAARESVEQQLTYVGFACMVDPPREGVREAVLESTKAGIKTIMITGDALATAETIGRQLAIVTQDDLVSEGKDAMKYDDDKFFKISVFARTNPADKQAIVERYQAIDRAVAVTGDGVNDALALSMSDVGVAMGITGTDVAKEAADMVIADDSYTSIVDGIRQGRGLFNKIRMMIFFYVAINLAESVLFFGTYFLGWEFLTPWQHIFLAISSHSWPGLALVFDRTAKYVMDEQPRNTEGILTRRMGLYLVLNSSLIFLGAVVAYLFTLNAVLPGSTHLLLNTPEIVLKANVMTMTVLLITESFMILSIRRINQSVLRSIRRESFWFIYAMIGMVFLMHLGLMYIPLAQEILLTWNINFYYVPLSYIDWAMAISLSLPALVGMEIVKWGYRRRGITL
jgi:Ca2+-transporting ATPase